MATLAIVLNTTKKLSNDQYSVALRVYHEDVPKYIAINTLVVNQNYKYQCHPNDWKAPESEDNGLGKFKKSISDYKELNEVLATKLTEARTLLKKYEDALIIFTFERFKSDLKRGKMSSLIQDYYQLQMDDLLKQRKIGLHSIYKQTKNGLNRFNNKALITDIDVRFLERYESYLRNERGNMDTTISVQMRNMQRVINLAIEDQIFRREAYPFGEKRYCITKRLNHKTRKRAVSIDTISKIKYLNVDAGSALQFAKDIFLFSFYTRGMNFADIANLKWSNIQDGQLHYVRQKTGQLFEIPVNDYIQAIIGAYRCRESEGIQYIFPVYPAIELTPQQMYSRKTSVLKRVNDNLKIIAKMIGQPNLKLTTYVSRHSYATNLKRSGVGTSFISEALGHETEQQTQTYLDEFEKGVIASLESKIFDF